MSIWTKPLWGGDRKSQRAAELPRSASLRMQYLGAATSLEPMAWWLGAMLLAKGLNAACFMLVGALLVVDTSGMTGSAAAQSMAMGLADGLFGQGRWVSLIGVIAFAIWVMPLVTRLMMRLKIARMTRESIRVNRRKAKHYRTRGWKTLAGVWGTLLLVGVVAVGTLLHTWVPAIGLTGLLLNYLGFGLIVWGWRSRVGTRIVCAKCDYAMGSWRAAADRCPECGNPWKEPWRARIGERRVRSRVIAMGAVVLVGNAVGVVVLMSLALGR